MLSCLWGTCYHFQNSQEYAFPSAGSTYRCSIYWGHNFTKLIGIYLYPRTLLLHQIQLKMANVSKINRKDVGKEQQDPCFTPGNQLEMDAVSNVCKYPFLCVTI